MNWEYGVRLGYTLSPFLFDNLYAEVVIKKKDDQ